MSFDDVSFAENPDPRCPVVLVLDCSDSMTQPLAAGERTPLEALSGGLDTLVAELSRDVLARRRVELSVVCFGTEVGEPTPFATVDSLVLPELVPSGVTSMGAALTAALDAIEERKRTYRANGVSYYRPWVLLITDGLPTDDVSAVSERLRAAEQDRSVAFFAVGVAGADLEVLASLSSREPLLLSGIRFDELFVWLSASQARVSASDVGDAVALPSPAGWAEV